MSSPKHKLRLAGAFAALATLALAASCTGFFVKPTLTALTVSPASPQVQINNSESLTAYGTYSDGSTGQVSSGVTWSSGTPGVATFSSPTSNVLEGVGLGTATITANAQAVIGTATATVFLGGITKITVSPTSGSFSAASGGAVDFTAIAVANGTDVDITVNGATWTITPTQTTVTCVANGTTESCGDASAGATVATYTITAGYPGTTIVGTATLNVTP
jgi:trimeric autotransporter adhesin